jgi:hypothetical protein
VTVVTVPALWEIARLQLAAVIVNGRKVSACVPPPADWFPANTIGARENRDS